MSLKDIVFPARHRVRELMKDSIYGGNPNRYNEITDQEAAKIRKLLEGRSSKVREVMDEFASAAVTNQSGKPYNDVGWGKYFISHEAAKQLFGEGAIQEEIALPKKEVVETETPTLVRTESRRNDEGAVVREQVFRPNDTAMGDSPFAFRPGESSLGDSPFAFRPGEGGFGGW